MLKRFAGLVVFGGARRRGAGAHPPRIWRRVFHLLAGSSIPLAGILAPEREFVIALAAVAVGALGLEWGRMGIGPLNRVYLRVMAPLLKSDEATQITGATYMLLAAAPLFWLYGKDVGVPVMFFLSLGDPAAALVGQRMPGPRVGGKSPIGAMAFAGVGAAAVGVLLAAGGVAYHWALWPGAIIAALVELAGIPPDDNLNIPLITGTAMWAMGA